MQAIENKQEILLVKPILSIIVSILVTGIIPYCLTHLYDLWN